MDLCTFRFLQCSLICTSELQRTVLHFLSPCSYLLQLGQCGWSACWWRLRQKSSRVLSLFHVLQVFQILPERDFPKSFIANVPKEDFCYPWCSWPAFLLSCFSFLDHVPAFTFCNLGSVAGAFASEGRKQSRHQSVGAELYFVSFLSFGFYFPPTPLSLSLSLTYIILITITAIISSPWLFGQLLCIICRVLFPFPCSVKYLFVF